MGGRLMPPVTVSAQRLSSGLEGGEFALDARAVGFAGDADVDFGPGFGGNHIGLGAAADEADADGEAALEVGPGADGLDDAGEFADGAGAFFEVNSGVGGDALDLDAPVAGAFAGGFVGQALGRFEHEDGCAGAASASVMGRERGLPISSSVLRRRMISRRAGRLRRASRWR